MSKPQAILAVLAGGRGERLGGAKAAATLSGRPLITYPLAAARAAGLPAIVVAKRATVLPTLEEQVLYEPDLPRHPLCGVLMALDFASGRSRAGAVLLAPCDMPFLTDDLLRALASLQGAAMAEVAGRLQPLPARCESVHQPALRRALAERRSLQRAIGALSPQVLDERVLARFGDPARICFNVNEAADLRSAERCLANELR
jgi:molybdenum cofactor guanylyltransferase